MNRFDLQNGVLKIALLVLKERRIFLGYRLVLFDVFG